MLLLPTPPYWGLPVGGHRCRQRKEGSQGSRAFGACLQGHQGTNLLIAPFVLVPPTPCSAQLLPFFQAHLGRLPARPAPLPPPCHHNPTACMPPMCSEHPSCLCEVWGLHALVLSWQTKEQAAAPPKGTDGTVVSATSGRQERMVVAVAGRGSRVGVHWDEWGRQKNRARPSKQVGGGRG